MAITKTWMFVAVLGIVGCADKAQPDYDKCVEADAKGDALSAANFCEAAVKADEYSVAGRASAAKLKDIQAVRAKAAAELKAKADAEAKAKQAAQDAADAACSKWGTICKLGRFPDGSMRTSGLQTFPTKATCAGAGAELGAGGGIECTPCRCMN
jgi:hypothetical protein